MAVQPFPLDMSMMITVIVRYIISYRLCQYIYLMPSGRMVVMNQELLLVQMAHSIVEIWAMKRRLCHLPESMMAFVIVVMQLMSTSLVPIVLIRAKSLVQQRKKKPKKGLKNVL